LSIPPSSTASAWSSGFQGYFSGIGRAMRREAVRMGSGQKHSQGLVSLPARSAGADG